MIGLLKCAVRIKEKGRARRDIVVDKNKDWGEN